MHFNMEIKVVIISKTKWHIYSMDSICKSIDGTIFIKKYLFMALKMQIEELEF